ncbi:MFS transporter [Micromonospora lupini]|uniref:Major facilitator superfamily MFS_1 n=1 Tax=Micromonospora lupini str. Lupac 08 TaxID=1150864 RepID=I0LEA9_9ACTN|nr:MFS transporter [Micromonospora lupini]CCH22156.1 Major facilitator superfamily MFS_1 [Micromonospora lupini str. Lupac 08]
MTSSALGRDFRLLWSASVSSRFGDSLRTPALALLAVTLTRDPRIIAAVTVAGQLPPLLFGLLGGVYADRWDRRRTMAVVDGVRAAVVAALAVAVVLDRAAVVTLLVAAFLLAALGTLFDSASFALLPTVVPPATLPRANGRLQAGSAVAGGFLGAPAAGVLFATAPALPFALDAVTFAVAALLVLALTPPPVGAAPAIRRGSVWSEIVEGMRWLRGHRTLWRVTLLAAACNLAISGLMAVLVLYALDVLRVPPAGYGLFAAGAILGGVVGALGAGRLAARLGTVPALRAVLAAQTVALVGFALARQPVPGGIALAVFAAGSVVWNSLSASYGQRHVPGGLLGRVGAAQRMVAVLTAPVGAALAGLAAAAYGTVPVAGAAAGTFALVTLAAWRTLRPVSPVPTAAAPTSDRTVARHPSR